MDHNWTTVNWAINDGEVSVMTPLRSILGWRTTSWWRSRSAWEHGEGPGERAKMEAQIWISQQMSKWAGEGRDWIQLTAQGPPRKEDVTISLLKMVRQSTEKKPQKESGAPKKKETKRCGPRGTREARGGQETDAGNHG